MKVFIGYDHREDVAVSVARSSLERTSGLHADLLRADRLHALGLLTRPTDYRGQDYDLHSNAPASTRFAISRFLVPIICQQGWALFTDCDMVFLRDVRELLSLVDGRHAVYVVKHQHDPVETEKMLGLVQTRYPRKNWSSVMLFNCDHPANQRLSLWDVNHRPGRDLHAFYWLADDEIGELPPEWNWLVGVQPKPEAPAIAHFTLGGPWFPAWPGAEHDDIWWEAAVRGP